MRVVHNLNIYLLNNNIYKSLFVKVYFDKFITRYMQFIRHLYDPVPIR